MLFENEASVAGGNDTVRATISTAISAKRTADTLDKIYKRMSMPEEIAAMSRDELMRKYVGPDEAFRKGQDDTGLLAETHRRAAKLFNRLRERIEPTRPAAPSENTATLIDQIDHMTAVLVKAQPIAPGSSDSYAKAFYELAEMLGVTGPRQDAPYEVHRREVKPALTKLIDRERIARETLERIKTHGNFASDIAIEALNKCDEIDKAEIR